MQLIFAKNLAVALKQPNVREFIKEQTTKQFDGDYNFLFGTHKDRNIAIESANGRVGEMSFKEILFGEESAKNGRSNGNSFLDSLSELYPLLQIAIPELANASAETWDADNEIPLIAVLPENIEGVETVTAYDTEGNTYQLAIDTEPDKPVIVISANERLIGVPKNTNGRFDRPCAIMQEAYYSTPTTDYYFADAYYEEMNQCLIGGGGGGSGGGGGTGGGTNCTCDRDCKNTKDELVNVKFNNMTILRDAEPWLNGKVELRALITIGNTSANDFWGLTKSLTGRRRDYRSCNFWGNCSPIWKNINAEILTWDPAEIGDRMKYSWYEVDNNTGSITLSATVKFGIVSTTGSTKFTLGTDRYELEESYVEYCDDADENGELYNTGSLNFHVKQR
ncbi:MAG: DUF3103 domain-containing protein [Cyclobacteriaceae bacterium]|nr:DUF3103 domain-containing protein [Cyclobacteriaceae bacterium]